MAHKENNKIKTYWKGFTLVETLVVMLVLVTVGSIILSIFIIGLTGAAKTRNQQILRENGNYAISQITKFVQYAQSFNYLDYDGDLTTTTDRIRTCEVGDEVLDEELDRMQAVSVTSFDGGQAIFACKTFTAGGVTTHTIASFSATAVPVASHSLINTERAQVVGPPDGCYFTCRQSVITQPPVIGLHFELVPNTGGVNKVIFETTMIPRNY